MRTTAGTVTLELVPDKEDYNELSPEEESQVEENNRQILIISSSPRKGGNSDTLCEEFMKGCLKAGHDVEKINLREHNLTVCAVLPTVCQMQK